MRERRRPARLDSEIPARVRIVGGGAARLRPPAGHSDPRAALERPADFLEHIGIGLDQALSLQTLWCCFVGVTLGTIVGVMPGIGALAAISLLLPYTFTLDATNALVMLAGVYYGSAYGGSTASFFGATVGILLLMAFAPAIAEWAFKSEPAEYFSMMLLGLVAASTILAGAPIKRIAMVTFGVLIGMIGTDVNSGVARYGFDVPELTDGVGIVAIALGIFGISEVIASIRRMHTGEIDHKSITLRSMLPTREDWRRSWMPMFRGSWIGSFFGALPGTGGTVAAFMAYALEKRISKTLEEFGRGAIEGVTAPESSSNACDQTAFIPTLTLGIPGTVTMALMLGNLMLLVLNIPLIGVRVRLISVPDHYLYPTVVLLVCIGVFSINNNPFDVWVVAVCGLVGYVMRLLDFPPAPLLLGFVLGPLMEEHLRRALTLSRGDFSLLLTRPISGTLIVLTFALLVWALISTLRMQNRQRAGQPATAVE